MKSLNLAKVIIEKDKIGMRVSDIKLFLYFRSFEENKKTIFMKYNMGTAAPFI